MSVANIMSTSVLTVEIDDLLKGTKDLFDHTRPHQLFGAISDRDLLKSLHQNIGTSTETAWDTASLNN